MIAPMAPGLVSSGSPHPALASGPSAIVQPFACIGTPAIAINATPTNGTAPLNVSFTSNITGGCVPYQIEWEFGDGGESEQFAPVHTYRGAGTFYVLAHVVDSANHSSTANTVIHVHAGSGTLKVTVEFDPAIGPAPLSTTGWANVTGGGNQSYTVSWTFGDGGLGTQSVVGHVYSTPGNYTAKATVRSSSGATASGSFHLSVTNPPPPTQANLTLTVAPAFGNAPLPVVATATSSLANGPYRLTICFENGGSCTNGPSGWSGASPIHLPHIYGMAGNFTVNATLSDSLGHPISAATAQVQVLDLSPMHVLASYSRGSGTAPLVVGFLTNVSGGTAPYSVQWSFGDGNVGSAVPGLVVNHTFTSAGTFLPELEVSDAVGHSSYLNLSPISVNAPTKTNGIPVSVSGVPTWAIVVVALTIVLLAGFVVGRRRTIRGRRRRWREEGEELVRELEQGS